METYEPATLTEWRDWLAGHCDNTAEIWLVIHRGDRGVDYRQATEEALCFGWIDSKTVGIGDGRRLQRYSPRNPRSTWSKVNRERAQRLIDQGRMSPHGQATIDLARRTGTWDALADADEGIVPDDLRAALDHNAEAAGNFNAFPPSSQRRILAWIIGAKRPETRERRITEAVALAARNIRAQHPGAISPAAPQ